jgi:hypothetical protein
MLDEELPPSRSRKPSVATRSGRRRGQARAVQMKRRISLGSERHYASLRPNANVSLRLGVLPELLAHHAGHLADAGPLTVRDQCRGSTRSVGGPLPQERLHLFGMGVGSTLAPSLAASAHHRHLCGSLPRPSALIPAR